MNGSQIQAVQLDDTTVYVPKAVMKRARKLVVTRRKVDAVLVLRNHGGLDLRTAKALVEQSEELAVTESEETHDGSAWMDLKRTFRGEMPVLMWLRRYPRNAFSAACCVWIIPMVLIVTGVFQPVASHGAPQSTWFYDLNTNRLFDAPAQIAPIEAPSGPMNGRPAGVRAYVFGCGGCDERNQYIGWLEVFSPAARDTINTAVANGATDEAAAWARISAGHMVRRVHEELWYRADSTEGQRILHEARNRCGVGEAKPVTCYPSQPGT